MAELNVEIVAVDR
ncbi:ATP synthase epsilon chain AtpC, partial [Mycobacterium tuberculosis TKK_05MA_2015]